MSQLRSVSFNPRDQHILAGGSIYGAVGIWDVRKSQGPVECVPIGVGHSESVTSIIWSNSKAGGEFFSGSSDGQVNLIGQIISKVLKSSCSYVLLYIGSVVGHEETKCPNRRHFT
jgi:WD40 repeat protein